MDSFTSSSSSLQIVGSGTTDETNKCVAGATTDPATPVWLPRLVGQTVRALTQQADLLLALHLGDGLTVCTIGPAAAAATTTTMQSPLLPLISSPPMNPSSPSTSTSSSSSTFPFLMPPFRLPSSPVDPSDPSSPSTMNRLTTIGPLGTGCSFPNTTTTAMPRAAFILEFSTARLPLLLDSQRRANTNENFCAKYLQETCVIERVELSRKQAPTLVDMAATSLLASEACFVHTTQTTVPALTFTLYDRQRSLLLWAWVHDQTPKPHSFSTLGRLCPDLVRHVAKFFGQVTLTVFVGKSVLVPIVASVGAAVDVEVDFVFRPIGYHCHMMSGAAAGRVSEKPQEGQE